MTQEQLKKRLNDDENLIREEFRKDDLKRHWVLRKYWNRSILDWLNLYLALLNINLSLYHYYHNRFTFIDIISLILSGFLINLFIANGTINYLLREANIVCTNIMKQMAPKNIMYNIELLNDFDDEDE